ncbi:nitrite reductase small subunit NirD [Ideonella dechloratans]|uniref:nitrite reductase small subunit NirD n=1 Tax=Ideonella dechloratans TaxID=36863 RepID=UPI0035ADF7B9
MDTLVSDWTAVCAVEDILPYTGVCTRVDTHQVAIFRIGQNQFFAIDNVDPKAGASVLSRGLVGNLGEHLVVASPLYKHHIDLRSGVCLESPVWSVRTYAVRVEDGRVLVSAATT